MKRLNLVSALVLLLAGLAAGSSAQPLRLGGQFQVNSYTTSYQGYSSSVAVAPGGGFVIVWDGYTGSDSSGYGIAGQRYASDGSTLGGVFQVNTHTSNGQDRPDVAAAANGDFVVVWESYGSGGSDSSYRSIQGQRYASDGSTLGGQFQVNTYTTGYQDRPAVASSADGDFVVVWESDGSGGSDSSYASTQGQRYASDGSTLGGEFQVNTYTTGYQYKPAVASSADGDFVVVWESDGSGGSDSSSYSVQGQRYASDGSTLGGEFQVNTYTTGGQDTPDVAAAANGDFVVVWETGYSATDLSGSIQGQRYASDGSTLGGEFQVNTYTTGFQRSPSVGSGPDGEFVVTWDSPYSKGTDTDSHSIQGQRYVSDGSMLGGEFQVNAYTTNYQFNASVGAGSNGDFVVAWASYGSPGSDSSDGSVQGQRFGGPHWIFTDGFESGDTSAW